MPGGVAKQISGKFLGSEPLPFLEVLLYIVNNSCFKGKEWEVEAPDFAL